MGLAVLLLLAGAAILIAGAEAAIRGAAGFARAAGIPLFALGALLFGIDLEGLGAAVVAAAKGQTTIAAGEAFGTILFLFGGAFALALILAKRPVAAPAAPMILAPAAGILAAGVVAADGQVGRLEGLALVVIYGIYVALVVSEGRLARSRADQIAHEAEEAPKRRSATIVLTLAGLGAVYLGATLLVDGGLRILERTALGGGFIGAAIVGALASLDELLLEVLPIRRGTEDLATGNLFGTLAAFCTGVLGLAALVRPLELDGGARLALIGSAVLYAMVAAVFLARGKAGRLLGVVLLASYAGWLAIAVRL